jgi:hypothetical protein
MGGPVQMGLPISEDTERGIQSAQSQPYDRIV